MQQGFDISKLYSEAHKRWLKPTEVLFILQNHENCSITPEPPNKPLSGSLFLFNRRVLRFFRNDGHAWRRKKDGRAVGEAHERLKVGNVEALNCYYAHGDQNPYFQRRSYWMLDPAYEHIVLVHYREVAEGRNVAGPMSSVSTNSSLTCIQSTSPGNRKNHGNNDFSSHSPVSVEVSSESVVVNNNSELDAYDRPENCGRSSMPQVNQALRMLELHLSLDDDVNPIPVEEKLPPYSTQENLQSLSHIDYGSGNSTPDAHGKMPHCSEYMEHHYYLDRDVGGHDNSDCSMLPQNPVSPGSNQKQQFQSSGSAYMVEKKPSFFWKEMLELSSPSLARVAVDTKEKFHSEGVLDSSAGRMNGIQKDIPANDIRIYKKDIHQSSSEMRNSSVSSCGSSENLISQKVDYRTNNGETTSQDPECDLQLHLSAARQFLLGHDDPIESLRSADQFQAVEDATPYNAETSTCDGNLVMLRDYTTVDCMGNMHLAVENTTHFSNHSGILYSESQFVTPVGPYSSLTVAPKQLFRIREISPEWGFSSESTKVIITGDFFCNHLKHDWKVMFGDVEVPAEIIQEGVLRCQAPQHVAGRVTLCVTYGNRESCSEVREFEYCVKPETSNSECTMQKVPSAMSIEELLLLVRFGQILLSGSAAPPTQKEENEAPQTDPSRKLKATNGQWGQIIESLLLGCDDTLDAIDWLLQELLKDKFKQWLASKSQEYSATDCSLSKQEQSIIHLSSSLGYEWALSPVLNAGVGVNFRDLNGWTALHWAARFGREKMVAALLAAGASAGAVTDPTTEDPVGKTPASIAAASGHKGLAGYLSEVSLTSHLSSLTMEEFEISKRSAEMVAERAVESISERNIQIHDGATEDQLSLKDSLAAVRNSTQAAARIQSAFRAHSFRKNKQKVAQNHDEYFLTPQEIHDLSAASKFLHGHRDQKFHTAALCIQRKYRGWRGRKNFLTLRQHVVKIQAHVRGHQVRKKYREFIWTVSVLEKVILRWRRRGAGLRGFKVESEPIDEIEADDILKVFRKQKVDAALDEAVSRVLSIVESPEARQQYRRMLGSYQLAKAELESASEAASSARGDHDSRETNEDMFLTLDEMWNQLDPSTMG